MSRFLVLVVMEVLLYVRLRGGGRVGVAKLENLDAHFSLNT